MQIKTNADSRKLYHFSKTMAASIEEFSTTAQKDEKYDASTWSGFIATGGEGQLPQIYVLTLF